MLKAPNQQGSSQVLNEKVKCKLIDLSSHNPNLTKNSVSKL